MKDFLCKNLRIERSDLKITALVFFYYFFVIFAYYLIKPSKEALFIQYMGAEAMSGAYVAIAIATTLFLFFYDYLVRKLRRKTFSCLLMLFFISNLLIFFVMFRLGMKKIAAYSLYVWSDVFSVASVTLFWSLTNDIYNSETAKKVYGFLGIGSQVGAIFGSYLTKTVAKRTETEYLLLISAAIIFLIIYLIVMIDGLDIQKSREHKPAEAKPLREARPGKGLSELYRNFLMVIRSRHLLYLTILLCVMLLCSNLLNYQIGRIIQTTLSEKNSKTVFYAGRYIMSNSLCLFFLLFASSFYRFFGIFGTLYTLPSVNLLTAVIFLMSPILSVVAIAKILDESLKYGVVQVTREMLYIPCTKEEKYRAKAVIDILFYRMVKILSALLMIVFTNYIMLSIRDFNLIIIAILLFNLFVLHKLKEAFLERIIKKINVLLEENSAVLAEYAGKENIESIDETQLMRKLKDLLTISDGAQRNLNVLEIVKDDLPSLAKLAGHTFHDDTIEKAILITGKFYHDDAIYSLGLQYLSLVLPPGARRKYLTILSRSACPSELVQFKKLIDRESAKQ